MVYQNIVTLASFLPSFFKFYLQGGLFSKVQFKV